MSDIDERVVKILAMIESDLYTLACATIGRDTITIESRQQLFNDLTSIRQAIALAPSMPEYTTADDEGPDSQEP